MTKILVIRFHCSNGFDYCVMCRESNVVAHLFLSKLDARYPWAPGVKSLTDTILSSDSIGDLSNQLYPLSRFVVEYPRLRVGVELLPSILELYQWLHSELTFAVSYEQATSITLGRLSKVLTRHSMLGGVSKLKGIIAPDNNFILFPRALVPSAYLNAQSTDSL